LTAAEANGLYVPSGWLMWTRASALVAQRLNLQRRELEGNTETVANPVGFDGINLEGAFSVSATGLVAYRASASRAFQLRWIDQTGKQLTVASPDRDSSFANPHISPDGRRIAVQRGAFGSADLWLLEGARLSRFTFDSAGDNDPVWSPDGRRVVFDSNRKGKRDLYIKSIDAGQEELILESPHDKIATDWSRDGRFVLYHTNESDWDLWVLPLEGDRRPREFLKTEFSERWAQFSPDGRWIAYTSNETGRYEIYIRPFVQGAATGPAEVRPGRQWQVSTAGGIFPAWRHDSKAIYYIGPNGQMMSASINTAGAELEPGTPVVMFQSRIVGAGLDRGPRHYDVAPDGRFLINTVVDDPVAPITLLLNWKPAAR
jgi:dipeptidyl aminopeptidase/acylaminoacyl peptidase